MVDAANRLPQVLFHHAVQLQPLPRGDPQRSVAVVLAQIQLGEELVGGHFSAGDAGADHEHVRLALAGSVGVLVLAMVLVVLLIGAVVLEQLGVVFDEVVGVFPQLLGDGAAKLAAPLFEELLFCELGFVRGASGRFGSRGGGGNIRART